MVARNRFDATSQQLKTEFIGCRNHRKKANEFKGLCCGHGTQT
jgi:hypothetical protein